jgi:hypothetical protein
MPFEWDYDTYTSGHQYINSSKTKFLRSIEGETRSIRIRYEPEENLKTNSLERYTNV